MTRRPQGSRYVYLFSEVELVESRVDGDWDSVRVPIARLAAAQAALTGD